MQLIKQFQQKHIQQLERATNQESFYKIISSNGIVSKAIISFFTKLYQYATLAAYSAQKKLKILNFGLLILLELTLTKTKQQFANFLHYKCNQLSKRGDSVEQSFSVLQSIQIHEYILEQILPYYQMYQIVLDSHPHFRLQAKPSEIVTTKQQNSLENGSVVDVETVVCLRQFIGIRAVKEEKKEVKKK